MITSALANVMVATEMRVKHEDLQHQCQNEVMKAQDMEGQLTRRRLIYKHVLATYQSECFFSAKSTTNNMY